MEAFVADEQKFCIVTGAVATLLSAFLELGQVK